jgi:hypothetical protein
MAAQVPRISNVLTSTFRAEEVSDMAMRPSGAPEAEKNVAGQRRPRCFRAATKPEGTLSLTALVFTTTT